MKITIGRAEDNVYPIAKTHRTVSKYHLEGNYHDGIRGSSFIRFEDISSNGTFLNGRRVKKFDLKISDKLRLGENYLLKVSSLFKSIKEKYRTDKQDYREEFSTNILPEFETYEKKRNIIIDGKQEKYIKIAVMLGVAFVLFVCSKFIDIEPNLKYIMIVIASLLASSFTSSSSDKESQKEALRQEYSERVICPKCENSLNHKRLSVYKISKRCLHKDCNALFF